MMRADSLNFNIYPLRTEMNYMQQITNSHIYSKEEIELKYFLVDETLSHIYYTDEE